MKEEQKHKQKAGGRRRKYRKNRSSILRVPPPIFLFASTSGTTSNSSTSTKQLQRGKRTVDRRNPKQRIDSTVEQRTKRGETMASLQRGRRRKTVAPTGFSATTTAGYRDNNATVSPATRASPFQVTLFSFFSSARLVPCMQNVRSRFCSNENN